MTKVCVVGGKLQGVEALYLAGQAGMETVLIDRHENPLGKKFCGRFICGDVIQYNTDIICALEEADFVLPALENKATLEALEKLAAEHDIRLVYDRHAYAISSSKTRSDKMMQERGLPCPRYYPLGKYPFIVKPSAMSCSTGVQKIYRDADMQSFLKAHAGEDWVAQEFLAGPSYSLEVIGTPGNYSTYHVTELFMDPDYDCKRVLSRPDLAPELIKQMEEETLALAEMVELHGIMDVEVIESDGVLRILEIDARIPSQTPITVYHATGWNMMTEMAVKFGKSPCPGSALWDREKYVSLEQILCDGDRVSVLGEHILSHASTLSHLRDFCGADEALTDYEPGKERWVATLICIAETKEDLEAKREKLPKAVSELLGREIQWIDEFPES